MVEFNQRSYLTDSLSGHWRRLLENNCFYYQYQVSVWVRRVKQICTLHRLPERRACDGTYKIRRALPKTPLRMAKALSSESFYYTLFLVAMEILLGIHTSGSPNLSALRKFQVLPLEAGCLLQQHSSVISSRFGEFR